LVGKRLQCVLSDYDTKSVNMYAVFPPGRYMSRRVQTLADYLSAYFGDKPYWDSQVDAMANESSIS
jgi:hypothetical protein